MFSSFRGDIRHMSSWVVVIIYWVIDMGVRIFLGNERKNGNEGVEDGMMFSES